MGMGFKHCAKGEAGHEGGIAHSVVSLTTGDGEGQSCVCVGGDRPGLSIGTGDILKWVGATITQLRDLRVQQVDSLPWSNSLQSEQKSCGDFLYEPGSLDSGC